MRAPMDRKKTMLVLLVIFTFSFLGWQVYQLVRHDIGTDTGKSAIAVMSTPPATVKTAQATQPQPVARELTQDIPENKTATSGTQQAYLDMMHKLEVVRMQRRLFDEEAAIASAKERIASLNHHAAQLTGNDSSTVGLGAMTLIDNSSDEYQLAYLDQQNGHWDATVLKSNRYQTATLNSTLADGSRVVGIDSEGLTLEKNKMRERLTFSGLTMLPPQSEVTQQPVAEAKPLATPASPKEAFSVSHLNKPVAKPEQAVSAPLQPNQKS